MTLEEIIDAHKATFSIKLRPGGDYDDYFAHISFEDGKIKVHIYDGEGGGFGSDDEPMRYEWIGQITKLVNDLKDAKMIPTYTLHLTPAV